MPGRERPQFDPVPPLRYPTLTVIIVIPLLLLIFGLSTHVPEEAQSHFPLSLLFPFTNFNRLIFGSLATARLAFWGAIVIHIVEGTYAAKIVFTKCRGSVTLKEVMWVAMVTLLGYTALRLLLEGVKEGEQERVMDRVGARDDKRRD